ncbi:class I SAM-dependent methyltransferase [Telmatospirillum siberiense]|uniref:S-adenosyl-L-methionine-dependent methyltransferase n=1 Tax=Telmatospirillum siberiense TaxID=382514 RepID=A0A2N3PNW2_9PROT|nr:SAM-dependent methyltransferase [Telmatospirillum siberiense]PKU22088.1 SAM-dependent methyltransferase [Telmatospirillum siberiense]
METVSYTAQWTAAARAVESERGEAALFRDDFARYLAEPKGFELLEKYKGSGVAEYVAIRTKYVDDAIERFLEKTGIRQIVLVASGMDSRAYRLPWPDDAVLYEVDHASLFDVKSSRLEKLSVPRRVRTVEVGVDLAGDWLPALEASGYRSDEKTLWVAEGLLFFLTEVQAHGLLSTLARASSPGSRLITDMTSATLLRHPITQSFLNSLRNDGTPWLFGSDDPPAFLQSAGWTLTDLSQPGEPGAGEGRWSYPVLPRNVPGVPRNWLITGSNG